MIVRMRNPQRPRNSFARGKDILNPPRYLLKIGSDLLNPYSDLLNTVPDLLNMEPNASADLLNSW